MWINLILIYLHKRAPVSRRFADCVWGAGGVGGVGGWAGGDVGLHHDVDGDRHGVGEARLAVQEATGQTDASDCVTRQTASQIAAGVDFKVVL